MDSSFYCVDEFDVFMDDVNRRAATKLLIDAAKNMSNRQFIFLTPLTLDYLKQDEFVEIFDVNSVD